MVHHIRERHKGKAFVVGEIGADQLKLSSLDEDQLDILDDREADQTHMEINHRNENTFEGKLS